MGITREGDNHVVHCDYCEYFDVIYTENDWSILMAELKERGWWKLKDKETGEWSHKCPTCVESRNNKRGGAPAPAPQRAPEPPPEDEPPMDVYEQEELGLDDDPFNEQSDPIPPPEVVEMVDCIRDKGRKVTISDCESCNEWVPSHGCTFIDDPF